MFTCLSPTPGCELPEDCLVHSGILRAQPNSWHKMSEWINEHVEMGENKCSEVGFQAAVITKVLWKARWRDILMKNVLCLLGHL